MKTFFKRTTRLSRQMGGVKTQLKFMRQDIKSANKTLDLIVLTLLLVVVSYGLAIIAPLLTR